ncbi:ribonuclease H-like domain-containing protein, partial [Tanacetum coccineum]
MTSHPNVTFPLQSDFWGCDILRRAYYKEYKISEADFENLHPNDFEDLYLLHLQGQLNHLSGVDKVHLFKAVNLWIKNIIIRKREEDLQLRIESYQTKLNLTQPDWDASDFLFKEDYTIVSKPMAVIYIDRSDQKKMMRETENIPECNLSIIVKWISARANIKQALGRTSRTKHSSFQDQERYEHDGPQDTRPQDDERSQDDDQRLDLADDLKKMDVKRDGEAIRTRFGGNANSKKMQKAVFKQQFEAFKISNSEGLEKGYDRFQQLLSQLEALQQTTEDLDLLHEDLKQIDDLDIEEMDINWQIAMIAIRMKKFYKKTGRRVRVDGKTPVGFDKKKLECFNCHNTGHFARECTAKGTHDGKKKRDSFYQHQEAGKQEKNQMGLLTMDDGIVNWGEHTEEEETNHALMAISSSNEVSLCSKTCIDSYNTLKTLCDEQLNQLGDQEAQILAYSQAVKKLEAQLVTFQKQQLSLNEKLTFQANEIYEKDEKLKKYRRIGMKAVKEKEQLQKTLDSWKDSSKNLWRLINSGMSSNSKIGLGYEIQSNNEVLSYEEEMNFSVFNCSEEDSVGKPLYSRFIKTNDFKGVPHPLSGDYTPKPQEEIDESLYVYGKKGPQEPEPSVTDDRSIPLEVYVSTPITTNEKDVSNPKSKEVEPSCVSHIKTPRQPIKDLATPKVNRKNWNAMMERELGEGYSFTKKKCFVCGSLSHLIKDCDYYEKKMAREAEVKKQRVFNTGNGVAKPVWTNANRVNHANQFVPRPVQLKTGRPNINSVRTNINTGRTNINSVMPRVNTVNTNVNTVRSRQPVPTRTSNSFSPKRPQVNQFNQRMYFSKSHSSVRRPFSKNAAQMSHSHAVKGNWGSAVKTSAGYNWRNSKLNSNCDSGPTFIRTVNAKGPQGRPKPVKAWWMLRAHGITRSTGGFEHFNGGSVTFGGSKGYISGQGKNKSCFPVMIAKATSDESKLWAQKLDAAFRRELEEIALKHLGKVFENTSTSTPLVNTGSESVNTGSFDPDDSPRPDIMYASCVCSHFQVTPKTSYLNAVKRIFKYLKGKPNLGLWYPRESPFDREAFSDSDYGGSNINRKSTTSGCQFLGQRHISWQCKKQTIVATSTT